MMQTAFDIIHFRILYYVMTQRIIIKLFWGWIIHLSDLVSMQIRFLQLILACIIGVAKVFNWFDH